MTARNAGHRRDLDFAIAHADQAFDLKARQDPADGLELQPEQAADLLAGHAQQETVRREAARAQPLRHIDQERGKPLLGAHRSEQQHQRALALDLAGEQPEQLALQRRLAAGQRIELLERNLHHLAVLERDGVAGIAVRTDAVEAQHLAGHVKTGDLLASVFGQQHRLERTGANAVERMERRAEPIQVFAAPHPSARTAGAREQHFHVAAALAPTKPGAQRQCPA